MIDTPFSQADCVAANPEQEALKEYVRALLARQQALDLLETIHQQIKQIWTVMRKLLDGAGAAGRAAQAVRIARAALAVQAQNSYHLLEKRCEECIAALHQAERRANAALHAMLTARPKAPCRKTRNVPPSSRARHNGRLVSRPGRRKLRNALSERR
jgi:L-serine deaminase